MITICEVGPRDGLQNERDVLPPQTRAELVNRLAAAGLPVVEAVSFVSAERVPQMAGAEEVVEGIERREGALYAGLALNEKGYDRLREAGLDEVRFAVAATESFSKRNANASVDEAVGAAEKVVARAREDGVRSTVTISVAFGCPFEGRVDPATVIELASRLSPADEVVLADTIGVATPGHVRHLIEDSQAQAASTATTLATRASRMRTPHSRPGRRRSTPRSAGSAAARSRPRRPATSQPRTSSTCSRATASRRASTWTR